VQLSDHERSHHITNVSLVSSRMTELFSKDDYYFSDA